MGVLILKSAKAASGLPLPDDVKPKYNKFKVCDKEKRTVDGIVFDSGKEAYRHSVLKILQRVGEITDLKRQQDFSLDWNGIHITTYRADFTYTDVTTGQFVVEDVKGLRTREYIQKRNMMKAAYGITIYET
jgi:hypothetical protein